jgi:membrane-bound serine protease (ClpP class)
MTTEAGFLATPDQSYLIGTVGVAATDLRPSGKMSFADQRIDVVAESGYVTRGSPIEVVALRNGSPVVRPLESPGLPTPT